MCPRYWLVGGLSRRQDALVGDSAVEVVIREYRSEDSDAVREIERRAGERFRDVGLDHIADHDPPSRSQLAAFAILGQAWVAEKGDGRPLGYLLLRIVDGRPHIEQVSVHPDHQGRGTGRALIAHALSWAAGRGDRLVTLNTYGDMVPWNAPLYRHLGFSELGPADIGPELRALCQAEADLGLEPKLRVTMGIEPVAAVVPPVDTRSPR